MRKLVALVMVFALVLGVAALVAPTDTLAKGKPTPPPCPCAPTVGPCTLTSCSAFDCVYTCPFP
jgi:hypothetical protein